MNNRPLVLVCVIPASFLAGLVLYHSGLVGKHSPPAPTPAAAIGIGAHRPDFVLADLEGKPRDINEWQNSVIVLNFWATWCAPCLKEIPVFIELQNQYQAHGLQFIGIALQHPDEILAYNKAMNIPYPLLYGGTEVTEIAQNYGNSIGALPYTVMVDRDGKIAFQKRGALSKSEAEHVILSLL